MKVDPITFAVIKSGLDSIADDMAYTVVRIARSETSQDRFGAFKKSVGYEGYTKSLYAQDWFDSSPERDVANMALYLASPFGATISGQSIAIDGNLLFTQ